MAVNIVFASLCLYSVFCHSCTKQLRTSNTLAIDLWEDTHTEAYVPPRVASLNSQAILTSSFWYWHATNDQKLKVGMSLGMRQKRSGNEAEKIWEWGRKDLGMRQKRSGNEAEKIWKWGYFRTLQQVCIPGTLSLHKISILVMLLLWYQVVVFSCPMAIFGTQKDTV